MNKEQELEQLVQEVKAITINVPPLFELFVTLFSILTSIVLFAYPDMIYSYPARLYTHMMYLMPQYVWALCFFVACLLKAVGLLVGINWLRIVGLLGSAALYIALTVCYAIDFPSLGAITFSCMTIFTILSIPLVKHTTIRHKAE
ncbi:hypothetical protein [Sporosarcina trichiuri]|uniref:hypothetical protein n=1 Tax=Sporosarcina trichiuri TaxID=3056445 RepID=UPI0025B44CC8|nr:hypothetical protein [Sporosarcina sp. 0.2-SM1T-5]WJY27495.1 hypothetical protein QWT68_00290 [Sporosarcina sp. 0.2-SM1T-5]